MADASTPTDSTSERDAAAPSVKLRRKRRGLEPIRYDAEGKELLSSAEAARRIGIKPGTLRKWRKAGRGPDPIKKPGNKFGPVFYYADEFMLWAKDNLIYRDGWCI